MLCCYQMTNAQQSSGDVIIGNVFATNDGALIGVAVREVDATNRIISATITDINGNFSLKVKNNSITHFLVIIFPIKLLLP